MCTWTSTRPLFAPSVVDTPIGPELCVHVGIFIPPPSPHLQCQLFDCFPYIPIRSNCFRIIWAWAEPNIHVYRAKAKIEWASLPLYMHRWHKRCIPINILVWMSNVKFMVILFHAFIEFVWRNSFPICCVSLPCLCASSARPHSVAISAECSRIFVLYLPLNL